jgi:predicted transcriptional regulator
MKSKAKVKTKTAAIEFLKQRNFLFLVGNKLKEFGLVGERRNSLILFLACLTSIFDFPVSVIVKGATSSGKSNLLRAVLRLFPSRFVICRTSLSGKALAHARKGLARRILYLAEFRGGKDAQYLIRLQQSEGEIAHEYANFIGKSRGTTVVRKTGTPVVVTSTTERTVFADDESRFLSLWVNESPEQTLAIVKAELSPRVDLDARELATWRTVTETLLNSSRSFEFTTWFESVARQLPVSHVRVRRDWRRFLSLCQAVALCRSFAQTNGKNTHRNRTQISFSDYCISYQLLNKAFSSTVYNAHEREIQIAKALKRLYVMKGHPLSVKEIAETLGWEAPLVYKFVKLAVRHHLICREKGTRKHNVKQYVPISSSKTQFLPTPQSVLDSQKELGEKVSYVHPLKGKTVTLERS